MSDDKKNDVDPEMLKNLDLLMDYEILSDKDVGEEILDLIEDLAAVEDNTAEEGESHESP